MNLKYARATQQVKDKEQIPQNQWEREISPHVDINVDMISNWF